jgi:hypothetical protein
MRSRKATVCALPNDGVAGCRRVLRLPQAATQRTAAADAWLYRIGRWQNLGRPPSA